MPYHGEHLDARSLEPGKTYTEVMATGCKHCKGPDNPEGRTTVKKAKVRHFGKNNACTLLTGTCANTGKPTKIFMSKGKSKV